MLSCRVANRGIEQTMVAFMAEQARARGLTGLVGELVPTTKNAPVMDLYPRLGFSAFGEKDGEEFVYAGQVSCDQPGHQGYTIRVIPFHSNVSIPAELNLVRWQ